jgi:hypothetical protein
MPMPVQTKREDEVFRMVAGVLMVAAILFGLLELMCKDIGSRSSIRAAAGILMGLLLEFAFLASPVSAAGANAAGQERQATSDVTLTTRPGARVVPVTPPLHLSDVQRMRIAEVLKGQDTEIDFKAKAYKSAKSFEPKMDEKLPKALKGQPFPRPLLTEMPPIRQYTYLKVKGQVLIVNPMTDKIVDMFPEQNG